MSSHFILKYFNLWSDKNLAVIILIVSPLEEAFSFLQAVIK